MPTPRALYCASGPLHRLCALPLPHRPRVADLSLSSQRPAWPQVLWSLGPAQHGAQHGTSTHRCSSSRWDAFRTWGGKMGWKAKDVGPHESVDVPVDSSTVLSGQRREHPKVHQQGMNKVRLLVLKRRRKREPDKSRALWLPLYEMSTKAGPRMQKQTRAPGRRRVGSDRRWARGPSWGDEGGLQFGVVAAPPGYDTGTRSCAF